MRACALAADGLALFADTTAARCACQSPGASASRLPPPAATLPLPRASSRRKQFFSHLLSSSRLAVMLPPSCACCQNESAPLCACIVPSRAHLAKGVHGRGVGARSRSGWRLGSMRMRKFILEEEGACGTSREQSVCDECHTHGTTCLAWRQQACRQRQPEGAFDTARWFYREIGARSLHSLSNSSPSSSLLSSSHSSSSSVPFLQNRASRVPDSE